MYYRPAWRAHVTRDSSLVDLDRVSLLVRQNLPNDGGLRDPLESCCLEEGGVRL